jgi:ADP-ribosyl-[dinitrogen reductase] hydrolase
MDNKKYYEISARARENLWINHAWGALMGVWCGDAAGAPLEGFMGRPDASEVTDAIYMCGGGGHNMDRGGITDDGELTCALLDGLVTKDGYEYPREIIAQNYRNWYLSEPFDIGNTCASAFGEGRLNITSEANGALMRVVPIAVWAAGVIDEDPIPLIREYATEDACLSHPNQICIDANILYCIAVAHLIKYPGDALGALEAAEKEADKNCTTVVKEWLKDSHSLSGVDFCHNRGHVRYGFMGAFYHLRRRSMYHEALCDILMRGGDTDTNAAIVGGMIGALMGYEWIPEYIKEPVFTHDCTAESNNHIRPIHYSVSQMWEPFSTLIPSVEAKSAGQRVPLRVIKDGQEGHDSQVIEWILAERERHCQAIANLDKILERLGGGDGI